MLSIFVLLKCFLQEHQYAQVDKDHLVNKNISAENILKEQTYENQVEIGNCATGESSSGKKDKPPKNINMKPGSERGEQRSQGEINISYFYVGRVKFHHDNYLKILWVCLFAVRPVPPKVPPRTHSLRIETYHVLYDFNAAESNQLSVRSGEKLFLINRLYPGWWLMKDTYGQTGLVPANYMDKTYM